MKKTKKFSQVLILFYPLLFFGQNITYDDLMQIENSMQFERVAIENNYEKYDEYKKGEWGDHLIQYGYELEQNDKNEYLAVSFATYNTVSNVWNFKFNKNNIFSKYNTIFEKVKNNCSFVTAKNGYAYYKCPDCKCKGNIAFSKKGNWDNISMYID